MTALRPEPDAGQNGPYAQGAYEADGTFEAAVEQLEDPLNDPLPGRHTAPWFRAESAPADGAAGPDPSAAAPQGSRRPQETPGEWYDPEGYQRDWYGQRGPEPAPQPVSAPAASVSPDPVPGPAPVEPRVQAAPARVDETVALRTADTRRLSQPDNPVAAPDADLDVPDPPAAPLPDLSAASLPTGGRAERRRAAKGRGKRRAEPRRPAEADTAEPAAVPMSRLEARRAARAAKDSPAVVASRVVGEVFITFGVLMLLFVTYQLWWTNIRADQIAGRETNKIQDDWANGERTPGAFEAGQGFAIMHIPKLDVVAPIAEGINKEKVLDRGMIGHYAEGKLKTAMPSAKQGNFAVAGHRNTHGEPFRYVNKLKPGDPIVVETREAYYTYEMTSILPQTSPSNVSVIDAVPKGSGFSGPGRYITLTTCTPEFTSTYRMIVWGKMVDERPRSEGKPDALVG
ncbi:class E sortase [Streptomyces sp. NBC_01102]|uniref:class E sortase n=1 Tax=Streptomyces sp. NBC_01102 TaxID=2903749 RepID=UPI0038704946|nr:class E sortase [Streptomyces sp. NBC_01102]